MNPERWRQIEQLYHAALEQDPENRARFLAEVGGSDLELRREVETLLAQEAVSLPELGTDHTLAPGTMVGAYRIEATLGQGGMGVVYRALDTKLKRPVAVKFMFDEVADAAARRRFQREAQLASSLNHPHIVTVHDAGEFEGRQYLVTEYVDGGTLKDWAGAQKRTWRESVELVVGVADGLAAAHAAGILHRDIKPANILVAKNGYAKLADFGLAKLAPPRDPEAVTRSSVTEGTRPGVILGTIAYMSPEQASGRPVDARSDIFSFGVVLYELLAGKRPFTGASDLELLLTIIDRTPEPLSEELPARLRIAVENSLQKEPAERYQSMQELVVDLRRLSRQSGEAASKQAQPQWARTLSGRRWVSRARLRRPVVILAVMLMVVAAIAYVLFRRASSVPSPQIQSLAVLPLENLSGDPSQEYFADGMTEALISNLAQIRAFSRVISRTSVMRYKGSPKSLPEIAAELKVDAVIEGTVQRSGGRVRVTAKLIPATTDSPVWARDYERDLSDVLKLQSDVARAVADEIRIQVTPEEQARLAAARSIDPKAHEAYLLGRHHLRTNEDDLRQAIGHFGWAIKLAPDYAAAYAGLSEAWATRGVFGAKTRREAMPLARDAAVKAVALDPQLPEAHVVQVPVKTYDWDWAGAEQEITRALQLDPNSARAHQAYADLLMALGRHAEAIREIERAEQLDPLSSNIQSRYGRVLYRARKYEEAVPHLQRAIDLDPNPGNSMPYWILGELYAEMGRYDEAIASLKEAQSHGGIALQISTTVAGIYARMGKPKEARRMLAELKATTDPASFSNAQAASAYTALGDKDEAFKVLFRLIEERNNLATFLRDDPPFESLHSDPRWKELLRRMNLPVE